MISLALDIIAFFIISGTAIVGLAVLASIPWYVWVFLIWTLFVLLALSQPLFWIPVIGSLGLLIAYPYALDKKNRN